MLKAVIFDLDGTLGDTLPLCVAAFRRALEPLTGKTLTDREIYDNFGPSEEGMIRTMLPSRYQEALDAYLENYRELHALCPEPFEGIKELLLWLADRELIVALVTGKGERSCRISLERFALDGCFDAVEAGSPLGPVKHRCIGALLKRYGISGEEALYVGDAVSDISASASAGVQTLSAAWAPSADREELECRNPGNVFTSVDALKERLERELGFSSEDSSSL